MPPPRRASNLRLAGSSAHWRRRGLQKSARVQLGGPSISVSSRNGTLAASSHGFLTRACGGGGGGGGGPQGVFRGSAMVPERRVCGCCCGCGCGRDDDRRPLVVSGAACCCLLLPRLRGAMLWSDVGCWVPGAGCWVLGCRGQRRPARLDWPGRQAYIGSYSS
jgi:hypothetical protein